MKNIKYILVVLTIFITMPLVSKAETSVNGLTSGNDDILFASAANLEKPNNSCLYKSNGTYSSIYAVPGKAHCLGESEIVTILNYDSIIKSTVPSCKSGFYYVSTNAFKSGNYKGYICADYVTVGNDALKDEIKNMGFPDSYATKLSIIKKLHPNWIFAPYKTKMNWNEAVEAESVLGTSYIQVTNLTNGEKFISLEAGSYDPINKKYIVQEGTNWYQANKNTVAYYLDPRNFLDEKQIFMFENLGYNSKYQTLEVVQNIFKNTKLFDYSNKYIEAATYNGNSISPISLAARSKQEVVLSDGTLSNSANGEGKYNNNVYYNVYNLGAFSSCSNPVECAISFAAGYGSKTSYNRPWNTIDKAILGGASYIAEGYINEKQNTLYFQKFNVTSNSYGNYSHQYMTNVAAPSSEGKSTYSSYANINGLLDQPIEFIIPVYEGMPEVTSLPNVVNESEKTKVESDAKKEEEDKKKEEEIKETSISNIVTKSGFTYSETYIPNINIGTSAYNVALKLRTNGASETKITRNNKEIGGTNTPIGTGDIISINNGKEAKIFRAVVPGDVNGDGKISAVDYVKVMNYIMETSDITGAYKIAADINGDSKVSAVDYVKIMNYIMNG